MQPPDTYDMPSHLGCPAPAVVTVNCEERCNPMNPLVQVVVVYSRPRATGDPVAPHLRCGALSRNLLLVERLTITIGYTHECRLEGTNRSLLHSVMNHQQQAGRAILQTGLESCPAQGSRTGTPRGSRRLDNIWSDTACKQDMAAQMTRRSQKRDRERD